MSGNGNKFRDAIAREVRSWGENIDILTEKPVGFRFVNTPRKLDIILKYDVKYLGIEAKIQESAGTAYQKLSYTLDDCIACPIPTIIVFAGDEIKDDMKSKLITSGIGIEVSYDNINDCIKDKDLLFRQRVYIELGLDWFKLY